MSAWFLIVGSLHVMVQEGRRSRDPDWGFPTQLNHIPSEGGIKSLSTYFVACRYNLLIHNRK